MSELSELPKGWTIVKIKNIFEFLGGGTPSKDNPDYWGGNLNWASVKDVKGNYLTDTQDRITNLGAENSATNIAFPNDVILITRINPGKAITSKIKTAINQDLKIVKPKLNMPPDFIRYLFASLERQCIKISSGTTVLGISLNNLNEIELMLPPLLEQSRIVTKIEELFSKLDKGIESLKVAQEQLKIYRQAVLKWAFEGKLTNDEVQGDKLPDGWELDKIGQVGLVQLGRQRSPKFHTGLNMRPYLRVQNVFENKIVLDDVMEMDFPNGDIEKYELYPGDILLNEGQSPELLGRPAMYRGEIPGACFTNTLIRFQAKDIVDKKYCLYLFIYYMKKGIFRKQGTITTNLAHLGAGRFAALDFPRPSMSEQKRIVAEIESCLSVCDKLEESIAQSLQQAEALRQSILKKAFEGKLVPQDPNDEPASVLLERIRTERVAVVAKNATTKTRNPRRRISAG